MALIEKPKGSNKVPISLRIPERIKEEVKAYCKWADINDYGYFYSRAVEMVFEKDKDWQKEKVKNGA